MAVWGMSMWLLGITGPQYNHIIIIIIIIIIYTDTDQQVVSVGCRNTTLIFDQASQDHLSYISITVQSELVIWEPRMIVLGFLQLIGAVMLLGLKGAKCKENLLFMWLITHSWSTNLPHLPFAVRNERWNERTKAKAILPLAPSSQRLLKASTTIINESLR